MCRRRKVTGTLTVRQGRRQCPEESREGYHCGRQNFWRHSKEMMAELCLEGYVSIDILTSGVHSWTPHLAPSPASHRCPVGIHGALVLPTSQARSFGLTFDWFSRTSRLQSISTIYLLSLQNTSWWHLEKSCVSSEARSWIQTLFLQSSDSSLLPKSLMDVENVFCGWTRVPWAGNVGKSDIEVGWDQVRKGFQFGSKSLNFSPQVLEMSNILG